MSLRFMDLHIGALHDIIDTLSNNCREKNKFISLLKRNSLEKTMTLLNWSEDRKQLLRERVALGERIIEINNRSI